MTFTGPNWKPSRTARKLEEAATKKAAANLEDKAKAAVRRRDRGCRFPLCGCRKLGLGLVASAEVSHQKHKGMGGNPSGDRSTAAGMIQLCRHRHQDGVVSRHRGTLRIFPLNLEQGMDGPVAFCVDMKGAGLYTLADNARGYAWRTLAHETRPGVLAPLEPWQRLILEELGRMER